MDIQFQKGTRSDTAMLSAHYDPNMKNSIGFFLAVLAAVFGFAHAAEPDVNSLAAKYSADIKAVDSARSAAISKVQATYIADLAAAEKAAIATGKVKEVAALLKVREAVSANLPEFAPHPDMTKAQAKRHGDFLASLAAIDREFSPKYARVNADCLRTVATFEAMLPANSPARSQVDALKTKILVGTTTGGALVDRLVGTKWQWWESQTIEFQAGGKGTYRNGSQTVGFRWLVTPDGKVVYNRDDQPGGTFTLEFEEGRVKIVNSNGHSWKGRSLGSAK